MKDDNWKLTIVKDKESGYTAWMDSIEGLTVQTETLDEIPEAISTSLKVMLMHGFDTGIHEIIEWDHLTKN